MSRHDQKLNCHRFLLGELTRAMKDRSLVDDSWIATERLAVAVAANDWAGAHGIERRLTVHDVERIEVAAVGHVDYASKLCLYIAEALYDESVFEGVR